MQPPHPQVLTSHVSLNHYSIFGGVSHSLILRFFNAYPSMSCYGFRTTKHLILIESSY